MTTGARSYLRAPHLRRSLISVATRAACLEIGAEWRVREIARLGGDILADPAIAIDPQRPFSGDLPATAYEVPYDDDPVAPAPPELEQTAAVPEALYVQHAALWNMRVDQQRLRRQRGDAS
jgi:hypothetical protein